MLDLRGDNYYLNWMEIRVGKNTISPGEIPFTDIQRLNYNSAGATDIDKYPYEFIFYFSEFNMAGTDQTTMQGVRYFIPNYNSLSYYYRLIRK